MLYQTDLHLAPFDETGLLSELAVKIHGAVMHAIPTEYARKLHESAYHPFSVFAVQTTEGYIVRISALNEEACQITEAIGRLASVRIFGCNQNRPVPIISRDSAPPADAETIERYVSAKGCRLTFVTPAVIKTGGRFSIKPEIGGYFQSVMKKYNEYEGKSLCWTEVQTTFQNVRFGAYSLQSTEYILTGRAVPGMTGFCELLFPEEPAQNLLLRKLTAYAAYCGIGAKTGQGMGGVLVQDIP